MIVRILLLKEIHKIYNLTRSTLFPFSNILKDQQDNKCILEIDSNDNYKISKWSCFLNFLKLFWWLRLLAEKLFAVFSSFSKIEINSSSSSSSSFYRRNYCLKKYKQKEPRLIFETFSLGEVKMWTVCTVVMLGNINNLSFSPIILSRN